MIIDVHAHLGEDVVFDEELTEDELNAAYEKHGIDGGIVQPYLPRIYMEDHKKIHDRIYRLTRTSGRRYWGMASINPHFSPQDYDREAQRTVQAMISAIEPLSIIMLGGIFGLIVLSIMLPLYDVVGKF